MDPQSDYSIRVTKDPLNGQKSVLLTRHSIWKLHLFPGLLCRSFIILTFSILHICAKLLRYRANHGKTRTHHTFFFPPPQNGFPIVNYRAAINCFAGPPWVFSFIPKPIRWILLRRGGLLFRMGGKKKVRFTRVYWIFIHRRFKYKCNLLRTDECVSFRKILLD